MEQLVMMIVTASVTGGISAVATVAALRVHIKYLNEKVQRNENAITRAHARIDRLRDSIKS